MGRRTARGRRRTTVVGLALLLAASACSSREVAPPRPLPVESTTTPTPVDPGYAEEVPTPPTPAGTPVVPRAAVQDRWDPRTAGRLERDDIGLPESLDPPARAPELTSMSAAVAMVTGERELSLVGRRGRWRRLPLPEEPLPVPFYAPATTTLTTDGTHVVHLGRTSLWSRDLRSTRWRPLGYPDGFLTPGRSPRRRAVPQVVAGAGGQVWLGRGRWWSVDLDAGTYDPDVPPPHHGLRIDGLNTLSHLVTDSASVAAVRGACLAGPPAPDGPSRRALLALDLDDLSARAYLPVRDPFGDYTCGSQLIPLGWVGADTVLVSVAGPPSPGADGWTLVTWDVTTARLRRVSAISGPTDRQDFDVAVDVLDGGVGTSP